MNILRYRETLSSVNLTYECTNTLKTLGKAEKCCANVLTNKEALRRLDRNKSTNLLTYGERNAGKRNYCTNVAINVTEPTNL